MCSQIIFQMGCFYGNERKRPNQESSSKIDSGSIKQPMLQSEKGKSSSDEPPEKKVDNQKVLDGESGDRVINQKPKLNSEVPEVPPLKQPQNQKNKVQLQEQVPKVQHPEEPGLIKIDNQVLISKLPRKEGEDKADDDKKNSMRKEEVEEKNNRVAQPEITTRGVQGNGFAFMMSESVLKEIIDGAREPIPQKDLKLIDEQNTENHIREKSVVPNSSLPQHKPFKEDVQPEAFKKRKVEGSVFSKGRAGSVVDSNQSESIAHLSIPGDPEPHRDYAPSENASIFSENVQPPKPVNPLRSNPEVHPNSNNDGLLISGIYPVKKEPRNPISGIETGLTALNYEYNLKASEDLQKELGEVRNESKPGVSCIGLNLGMSILKT